MLRVVGLVFAERSSEGEEHSEYPDSRVVLPREAVCWTCFLGKKVAALRGRLPQAFVWLAIHLISFINMGAQESEV